MATGVPSARADTFLGDVTGSYLQLHTGDPGAAGTSNVSTAAAVRKAATFGAAATNSTVRQRANTAIVRWDSGDVTGSQSITHWSLWTASTAGTFLQSGTVSLSLTSGVPAEVPIGGLVANIGPLAS